MAKKLAARPTSAAGSLGAASTLRFARNHLPQASRAACDAGAEFIMPRREITVCSETTLPCSLGCALFQEMMLRVRLADDKLGSSVQFLRSVRPFDARVSGSRAQSAESSRAQKSQFVLRADVV